MSGTYETTSVLRAMTDEAYASIRSYRGRALAITVRSSQPNETDMRSKALPDYSTRELGNAQNGSAPDIRCTIVESYGYELDRTETQ